MLELPSPPPLRESFLLRLTCQELFELLASTLRFAARAGCRTTACQPLGQLLPQAMDVCWRRSGKVETSHNFSTIERQRRVVPTDGLDGRPGELDGYATVGCDAHVMTIQLQMAVASRPDARQRCTPRRPPPNSPVALPYERERRVGKSQQDHPRPRNRRRRDQAKAPGQFDQTPPHRTASRFRRRSASLRQSTSAGSVSGRHSPTPAASVRPVAPDRPHEPGSAPSAARETLGHPDTRASVPDPRPENASGSPPTSPRRPRAS